MSRPERPSIDWLYIQSRLPADVSVQGVSAYMDAIEAENFTLRETERADLAEAVGLLQDVLERGVCGTFSVDCENRIDAFLRRMEEENHG